MGGFSEAEALVLNKSCFALKFICFVLIDLHWLL